MPFSFKAAAIVAAFAFASLTASGTPVLAGPAGPLVDSSTKPLLTPQQLSAGAQAQPGAISTKDVADQITISADADDNLTFASLAEAVAAQAVPDEIGDDLRCLAGAIYFESKGEPLDGQLAVGKVVINRATSGRFPQSICSVVTQPGQFAFVRGGRIPSIDLANPQYRTAMSVAQVALDGSWDNPAPKALFFHARGVSPGWRMARVASIGNHVFYR